MSVELRKRIGREEFDYQALMSALSNYASPRDRVTALLQSGTIIRVKKGLYIFGEAYRQAPYCRELLANLMYGPSVVSLEYALGYYGLIPERVEALTSVAMGRARRFETPVGLFIYRPTKNLSVGMERMGAEDARFLMAVPERALADCIRNDRRAGGRTQRELARYLFEDLRMEEREVGAMDAALMGELADALSSRKVWVCAALIRSLRRRK
jgi:predicted transcriptional regulator of viral defense system